MKQPESIADFKHRIALLMRNREGGREYSIIGAARPDPCVIRPKKQEKYHEASEDALQKAETLVKTKS